MIERIGIDMFKLTNGGKTIMLNTKELLEVREEIQSIGIDSSLLD